MKLANKQAEIESFSFHIRGCRQLSLDGSSFKIPGNLCTVFNPVKNSKPRFHATLDPRHPDCYSCEIPVRDHASSVTAVTGHDCPVRRQVTSLTGGALVVVCVCSSNAKTALKESG